MDFTALAKERGGRLNVIGNLPYHITTEIFFHLADHHESIHTAVVTTQLEVAERLVAAPRTKQYGILSVIFQLYAAPFINFHIPPTVFFPKPTVR